MEPAADAEMSHMTRNIVPGQCVRLTGETTKVAIPGHGSSARPAVELIREGDKVQFIEVTCACGQRIRIRCIY